MRFKPEQAINKLLSSRLYWGVIIDHSLKCSAHRMQLANDTHSENRIEELTMWYFSWILGVGFACAFGIINAMWLEAECDFDQCDMDKAMPGEKCDEA